MRPRRLNSDSEIVVQMTPSTGLLGSDPFLEPLQAVCRVGWAPGVSIFSVGWGSTVRLAFAQATH